MSEVYATGKPTLELAIGDKDARKQYDVENQPQSERFAMFGGSSLTREMLKDAIWEEAREERSHGGQNSIAWIKLQRIKVGVFGSTRFSLRQRT